MLLEVYNQTDPSNQTLTKKLLTISVELPLGEQLRPVLELHDTDSQLIKFLTPLSAVQLFELDLNQPLQKQVSTSRSSLKVYALLRPESFSNFQQPYTQLRRADLDGVAQVENTLRRQSFEYKSTIKAEIDENALYGEGLFNAGCIYRYPQLEDLTPFRQKQRGFDEFIDRKTQLPEIQIQQLIRQQLGGQIVAFLQLTSKSSNSSINPNQFEAAVFIQFHGIYVFAYISVSKRPYSLRILQIQPILVDFQLNFSPEPMPNARIQNEFGLSVINCLANEAHYIAHCFLLCCKITAQLQAKSVWMGLQQFQQPKLADYGEKPHWRFSGSTPLLFYLQFIQKHLLEVVGWLGVQQDIAQLLNDAERRQSANKGGQNSSVTSEEAIEKTEEDQTPMSRFRFLYEFRQLLLHSEEQDVDDFMRYLCAQVQKADVGAWITLLLCIRCTLLNAVSQNSVAAGEKIIREIAAGDISFGDLREGRFLVKACSDTEYILRLITKETWAGAEVVPEIYQLNAIVYDIDGQRLNLQLTDFGKMFVSRCSQEARVLICDCLASGQLAEIFVAEESAQEISRFKSYVCQYKMDMDPRKTKVSKFGLVNVPMINVQQESSKILRGLWVSLFETVLYNNIEYILLNRDSNNLPGYYLPEESQHLPLEKIWVACQESEEVVPHFMEVMDSSVAGFQYLLHKLQKSRKLKIFDLQPLQMNQQSFIICCSCPSEKVVSWLPKNAMPLHLFLRQEKHFATLLEAVSAWRGEHCIQFGELLHPTGLQHILSAKEIIDLVVPLRRQCLSNTVLTLLRVQPCHELVRALNLSPLVVQKAVQDGLIQPVSYQEKFLDALKTARYTIPLSETNYGTLHVSASQEAGLEAYCLCLERALKQEELKAARAADEGVVSQEVGTYLDEIYTTVTTRVAGNTLRRKMEETLQQAEQKTQMELQRIQEPVTPSSQSRQPQGAFPARQNTEKGAPEIQRDTMESLLRPAASAADKENQYLQFFNTLLLHSARFNLLSKMAFELSDSLQTAVILEQQALSHLTQKQYLLTNNSLWVPPTREITLLCSDGEIKVPDGAQISIGNPGTVIAVAEKKAVVKLFIQFLEERQTQMDVLVERYKPQNFLVVSGAVNSILGFLLHHMLYRSPEVLEKVLSFSFEEAVLRIADHPLMDYFCFLHYKTDLEYAVYTSLWDTFLAFRMFQASCTGKAIQVPVLYALFRKVVSVDTRKTPSVSQRQQLQLLVQVAPHLRQIIMQRLTQEELEPLRGFRCLQEILVEDYKTSSVWIELLPCPLVQLE